jgi:hypothetical protein
MQGFIEVYSHSTVKGIAIHGHKHQAPRARGHSVDQDAVVTSQPEAATASKDSDRIGKGFIAAATRKSRLTNVQFCGLYTPHELPAVESSSAARSIIARETACELCLSVLVSPFFGSQHPYHLSYLTTYDYIR